MIRVTCIVLQELYKKAWFPYGLIISIVLISTFILWLPFILNARSINGVPTEGTGFQTVVKNWDGPLYIIPAKTLYDANTQILEQRPLGLAPKYFAAHLPGYPLTIRLLAPFVGYPKATIMSTLLASAAFFAFFYFFVKKLRLTSHPLALTSVLMFVTPRFFVTRSVGSPEPMFLLLILSSIYCLVQKRYLLSGLTGALAIATKTPAGLLFVGYGLYFVSQYVKTKKINWHWLWLLLIPGGLIGVFLLYSAQYGDFFAYFNSGDNIHLISPFAVFNFRNKWVNTAWLEEVVFLYFFYLLAIIKLFPYSGLHIRHSGEPFTRWRPQNLLASIKYKLPEDGKTRFGGISFYFLLTFFTSILFVQHRDIARYSLPILPLALIAFEKFFTSRAFIIALVLLIPAIFLYAWNFMIFNVAPITDWIPFL